MDSRSPAERERLEGHTNELYQRGLRQLREQTDKIVARLLVAEWLFGIGCALFVSPRAWYGDEATIHMHVWTALLLGGILVSLPVIVVTTRPGTFVSRHIVTLAQMLYSVLLIHLMGGRLEAHFHVFGSLAILAAYRDPWIFLPAVLITTVDHAARGMWWPESVYGVEAQSLLRSLEHAAWVLFETSFLLLFITQNRRQLYENSSLQVQLIDERDRLEDRVTRRTASLRQSEAEARAVLESSIDAIIVADEEGRIQEFNPAAESIFGIERSHAIGQVLDEVLIPPALRAQHNEAWQHHLRTGESNILGKRVKVNATKHDGGEFPIELCVVRVKTDRPLFFACARDLTKTVEQEIALRIAMEEARTKQSLLDNIINNIPISIFWKDRKSRYLGCNSNFAAVAGKASPADLIGKSDFDMPWGRVQAEAYRADDRQVLETEQPKLLIEETIRTSDGEDRVLLTSKVPLVMDNNVEGVIGIFSDVTDHKRMERSLTQARKLESIGQMAAGIAHEINTPLQCVASNLEFMRSCSERMFDVFDEVEAWFNAPELPWQVRRHLFEQAVDRSRFSYVREQLPRSISEAGEASQRVIDILRAMKSMSHPGTKERVPSDINGLLQSAVTISRNRWKYAAKVELDLAEDLPEANILPAELSQVFLNLLVNASDAIQTKFGDCNDLPGRIIVRTTQVGSSIRIDIADNGTGIPDEVASRVFDPFFTTKGVGKGTGQGLAIAYDVVVHKLQGAIDFTSQVGQGTAFTVTIPLDAAPLIEPLIEDSEHLTAAPLQEQLV